MSDFFSTKKNHHKQNQAQLEGDIIKTMIIFCRIEIFNFLQDNSDLFEYFYQMFPVNIFANMGFN
jgi:hypothetical protein